MINKEMFTMQWCAEQAWRLAYAEEAGIACVSREELVELARQFGKEESFVIDLRKAGLMPAPQPGHGLGRGNGRAVALWTERQKHLFFWLCVIGWRYGKQSTALRASAAHLGLDLVWRSLWDHACAGRAGDGRMGQAGGVVSQE